jgi:hypothetical protein
LRIASPCEPGSEIEEFRRTFPPRERYDGYGRQIVFAPLNSTSRSEGNHESDKWTFQRLLWLAFRFYADAPHKPLVPAAFAAARPARNVHTALHFVQRSEFPRSDG